jgi:hypothetical protein
MNHKSPDYRQSVTLNKEKVAGGPHKDFWLYMGAERIKPNMSFSLDSEGKKRLPSHMRTKDAIIGDFEICEGVDVILPEVLGDRDTTFWMWYD